MTVSNVDFNMGQNGRESKFPDKFCDVFRIKYFNNVYERDFRSKVLLSLYEAGCKIGVFLRHLIEFC
jgi:hypothetical protein